MIALITRISLGSLLAFGLSPAASAQEFEPATTTYPAADPDGEILNTLQPETEAERSFDVHLNNGEFFIEHTDLTIAGRGFDFEWKRTYRSRGNTNGPMGHNWDHSYNIYLEQDGADLILHDGDHREDRFSPTATSGTWASLGHFRTIYVKDPGTPSDPSDDHYVVVLRHNSKWVLNGFDGSATEGKVRSIIDRNGNVMLLEYSGRTGRLVRIKDTLHEDGTNERVIDIRYNAAGRIREIEDFCTDLGVGGAGRKVNYVYWTGAMFDAGEPGDLRSATSPAVITTTGNDFPNGKTWYYEYTVGSSYSAIKHNLTAVFDPKGQNVVQNVYFANLPTDYVFDRVLRQRIGGGAGPQFNYWYASQTPSAANNFATHGTVVNDRVGNVCELYYANEALGLIKEYSGRAPDPKKLTKFAAVNMPINPLRPGIDPASWETKITVNSDGLVEELEAPNEELVTYCYDSEDLEPRSRGNLVSLAVLPGTGIAPENDFADLDKEWSLTSIFNFEAQEIDFRGLVAGLTYDGPGIEEPFESCVPPAALTINDGFGVLPVEGRVPGTHSVAVGSLEPDPNIVYSEPADQTDGDSGENGGEEPTGSGGGGCSGENCPEEPASSSSLALTGCNCYSYTLNDAGQRTSALDPEEVTTTFVYYNTPPMHGYLANVITDDGPGGLGLTETYTYNLAGHVVSYTDAKAQTTTYEVNALGQVVRETGPAPSSIETLIHYDANDNVIQVDIENVESLVSGHSLVSSNPWITTTFTYDVLNNRTSVAREIDTQLDLLDRATTEFEYDDNENLSLVKLGEATNGNQSDNTIAFVWDERDLLFDETRGPGSAISSTTRYDYDENGNLMTKKVGTEAGTDQRVYEYEFNGYDRLKKVTDPMGNVLDLDYDRAGNVLKRTWMGELVDTTAGTPSGPPTDPILREIEYTWDERERLEDSTYSFFRNDGMMTPTTSTFSTYYNGINQIRWMIDGETNDVTFGYDTAHRLDGVYYPLLNRTEVTMMDPNGNPLETEDIDITSFDPAQAFHAATTNFVYDELDRLTQSTDNASNVTKLGYDSRGNLIQTIDANGVEKRFLFDGLNRMLSTAIDMNGDGASEGDVDDIVTTQVWDDSSRLIAQVDDSGNATRYAFDELNRQVVRRMADGTLHQVGLNAVWMSGQLVPDLSAFQTGYDVHSNRIFTRDANGTDIVCSYDENDRLITRDVTQASASIKGTMLETYTYDGLGRIVKAENDNSIVNRTYDSMDNLVIEEIVFDKVANAGPVTERTYDRVGNELVCDYPGGRSVSATYDEFNRKSTITDGSIYESFFYLGRNVLEARELGNQSITSSFQFNYTTGAVRTPTAIRHEETESTTLSLNCLTWDGIGNKLTKQNAIGAIVNHTYQYDDAYRLTNTTVTDVVPATTIRQTDYDLDSVHNRESVTETLLGGMPDVMNYTMTAGSPVLDFELNQYSVTPADSRVYDQNGNWIEKRDPVSPTILLATIYYDAFNRMVEYQESGG